MQDGNEYASVANLAPENVDFNAEIRRAIADLEGIRGRPCACYVGNVIGTASEGSAIEAADDLPFNEMIASIPGETAIDVFLASNGGSGSQVARFVELLHSRFSSVHFLLPAATMSAATLWALSGHEIWMDSRAHLGPIDPQVPGADGRLLPAQALLALLRHIQEEGQRKIAAGGGPDWSHAVLLRSIDQTKLGAAMTLSQYSIGLAQQYLEKYKFQGWITRLSGEPVTSEYRQTRAREVAADFGDHIRWKAHGHAISRAVAETEMRLKIEHLETVTGLERAVRRLWALCYLLQDKSRFTKIIVSKSYSFFRITAQGVP